MTIGPLRCVRCDLDGQLGSIPLAEYVYGGESLCRIHFLGASRLEAEDRE